MKGRAQESATAVEVEIGSGGRDPNQSYGPGLGWSPIVPVLVCFWLSLLYQLSPQWYFYEQYHYGWAVPFLSLYLLHRRLSLNSQVGIGPVLHPGSVVLLLAGAAILYAPTRWLCEANSIWRLTISLWAAEVIVLTLCLVYLLRGKSALRQWCFPIAFMFLAVPWPSAVENLLVRLLTHFNSSIAVEALSLLGVQSIQHDSIIETAGGNVGIDDACSGLQSFQATLMLSVFFGAFYRMRIPARMLLVLAGGLICLLCNSVRTVALAWITAQNGISAMYAWHDALGLFLLIAVFLLLWFLGHSLGNSASSANAASLRKSVNSPGAIVRILGHRLSLHRLWVPLAMWFLCVECGTRAWYWYHEHHAQSSPEWSLNPQSPLSGFQQLEVPVRIRNQFFADEAVEVRWQGGLGVMGQAFYFRWLPACSLWDRVRIQFAKTHQPERCLPAQGMRLVSDFGTTTVPSQDIILAFRNFVFQAGEHPVHVLYGCYEDFSGGESLAFTREDARSRVAAALAGSRNSGQRWLQIVLWGITNNANVDEYLRDTLKKLIKAAHAETLGADIR